MWVAHTRAPSRDIALYRDHSSSPHDCTVSSILKACSFLISAQPNTKQGQKPAYEKKTRAIHVTVSSRYKATPWDTLDMISEEHSQVLMMLHYEAVWCGVAVLYCSMSQFSLWTFPG